MGIGQVVRQRILVPRSGVRIPHPQPSLDIVRRVLHSILYCRCFAGSGFVDVASMSDLHNKYCHDLFFYNIEYAVVTLADAPLSPTL